MHMKNKIVTKLPYLSPEDMHQIGAGLKEWFENRKYVSWVVRDGIARDYIAERLPKGERLLDVACCTGEFMFEMKQLGYDVHGGDIDDYIRYDEIKNTFTAFDASMETYPYTDESFGAVTLNEALDHLENPYHAFREIHRVLKPNGIFICSGSNAFNIWNRVRFLKKGDLYEWRKESNHVSPLTKGVLDKSLFTLFRLERMGYDKGYAPYLHMIDRRLSKILPRSELFSKHGVYFLRKKKKDVVSV